MVLLVITLLLLGNGLLMRWAVRRVVARGMPRRWRYLTLAYLPLLLLPVCYALFWARGGPGHFSHGLRAVLEPLIFPLYLGCPAVVAARVAASWPQRTLEAYLAGWLVAPCMPFCIVACACLLAGACL
ncbi:hypothetical protein PQU95_04005 [Vogesella sp. DC21W]|uniref:Metallophosphoesterase n=1 Tax=Vogesella aquatica TaxID=2984206 RepID=A0ABT5IV51_9NEIS|nr:hypothetical protein [Vogesella aquatica]MDC7716387.1 hypothetical protein [Vogesella aquatica]